MATFFTLQFGALNAVELSGFAINKNDANLYIGITGVPGAKITPLTTIKAIVAPDVYAWDDAMALDFLQGPIINDSANGIYTTECQNNSDSDLEISFRDILIRPINKEYPFENTKYNVYWLISLGTSSIQGSASGFYTLPHNIQPYEVKISGGLTSTTNETVKYNIKWNKINNEDNIYYGGIIQPYVFTCSYFYDREDPRSPLIDEVGYPSGTMPDNGITFEVPFYYRGAPDIIEFSLTNRGIAGYSDTKRITIYHDSLKNSNNYFSNLDESVFSEVNRDKIKRVGEFEVEKDIIDRRRLSIGINDISVKDNSFVKQGTYISPYYPLDGNLYTLSLNVDEIIPNYPGINPYNVIKYFIEVNSIWEPISPISREDEFDAEGILIPKIFVFDRGTNKNSQVKYIETSLIKIIRVKIVFDLSFISGEKFIPPEVRDYKCIIYDKDQLNEF